MSNLFNCGHCGRFMSYDEHDEYTNFGSYGDLEPPDPIYVCAKCAAIEKASIIKSGNFMLPYLPSRYMMEAIEELGLVEAGPHRDGPSFLYKKDEVPEGYVLRKRSVYVP